MSLEAKIEANTEAVKALTAAIANLAALANPSTIGDDALPVDMKAAPEPVEAAPKKTTKRAKKAEPAPIAEAPAPQPESGPTLVPQDTEITNALPPTVPPTKEEFTRVMHRVVAEKGRDALVRLLDSFGYSRVFEAPETRWADMVVAAEEILIN